MKISVIIPAYNVARILSETLSHLQKSEYQNYEVIVVDDGSDDETSSIAEQNEAKLLRLETNGGAAVARNRGSKLATGEILFFIDADVRVTPQTLSIVMQSFQHELNPVAVVGAYKPEQPVPSFYSHFQNFYTFYNHDRTQSDAIDRISWFWTACGALKKDVFDDLGGFREVYVGASAEDMDLGYRLAERDYPIIFNKDLEVTHAHHHSLKSIMKNNYKKAAAWGELYLRKNKGGSYKHGFTSMRNFVSLLMVALLALSLFCLPLSPWFIIPSFVTFIIFSMMNREFYHLISHHKGFPFLLRAIPFHILATFFIGLGGLVAIGRNLTGREGEVSQGP